MRSKFKLRTRLIAGGFLLIAMILVGRLYMLQIMYNDTFLLRAERQFVRAQGGPFDRGSITFSREGDAGRVPFSAATLASGFIVAVQPDRFENREAAERTYARLSEHLSINPEFYFARAMKENDPYEEIATRVPEEIGRAISSANIPGVVVSRDRWRLYPTEEIAAHTIGFVGFDGDRLVGRYGLERSYNDVLARRDKDVYANFFLEIFGNVGSMIFDNERTREGDLTITLEPEVSQHLHHLLQNLHTQLGSRETGAIIMNPKTGEIIALDAFPTFNPNTYAQASIDTYSNPLIEKVYEFGSIIKPLTVAAGLDARVITPESTYVDTGRISVDGATISNFDGRARGEVLMQEILSQSLNTGVAHITLLLGTGVFREYFTKFGITEETGIDLPNEASPIVSNLQSPRKIEYVTASFGQGIALTPIAATRALATLANEGKLPSPHIGKEIRYTNGLTKELGFNVSRQVIRPESAEATTRILVEVVDSALVGGVRKIPEMSIAAKTGTAQIPSPSGGYYSDRYLHSFFGYFPAYNPEFIIFLYTVEPKGEEYASRTLTTPFFDIVNFLVNYYSIPPDRHTAL